MKAFIEDKSKKKMNTRGQTYKFIDNLKGILSYTNNEDKEFIKTVLKKAQEGVFPEKTLLKKLNSKLNKLGNNIYKKVELLRCEIPQEYLMPDSQEDTDEQMEVILSVYLKPESVAFGKNVQSETQ